MMDWLVLKNNRCTRENMDRRAFAKQMIIGTTMAATPSGLSGIMKRLDSASSGSVIPSFTPLFNGQNLDGFVDMNTSEDTWWVENGILKCTGKPIGVMRTEKQYENFILDIEWRHMEPGGNSGVFVWANGTPYQDEPFPTGIEVQCWIPAGQK